MTVIEMRVHMDCGGCQAKIMKSIKKLEGVDEVDIDMGMQKVTVMGWADRKKVLRAVRKTGRRAELWPFPYNPEYDEFNQQYNNNNNYQLEQQHHHQLVSYNHGTTTFTHIPPASSYNYYKHGYSDESYGYYQNPPYATIVDQQASSLFSDENPHACSIM